MFNCSARLLTFAGYGLVGWLVKTKETFLVVSHSHIFHGCAVLKSTLKPYCLY